MRNQCIEMQLNQLYYRSFEQLESNSDGTIWGNAVKHPVCLVYPPRKQTVTSGFESQTQSDTPNTSCDCERAPHHVRWTKRWLDSWFRSLSARAWAVDAIVTVTPETVCLLFCHLYSRPAQCKCLLAPTICQRDKIPVAGVNRWLLEDTIFTHGEC